MTRWAWSFGLRLACAGMLGCSGPQALHPVPDDLALDAVWASLARGDLGGGQAAAEQVVDGVFRVRAARDVQAARDGRAAALCGCLENADWLAARFDASHEVAMERLRDARRQGVGGGALWLEEARASVTSGRRLSAARAARDFQPGSVEALAIEVETLQAEGELGDAEALLATAGLPDTARLRLARRRQDLSCGRLRAAAAGLVADVRDGLAVPASLGLLEELLFAVPMLDVELEARAALGATSLPGRRMARARDRLLARIEAASGDVDEAVSRLSALETSWPQDERRRRLWESRLGRRDPATLEELMEQDPERVTAPELAQLRLADAWNVAALQGYADDEQGHGPDLPSFLSRLDVAAKGLPAAPALVDLPRREYGIFGTLVDTDPLRARLPGAVLVAGKALGLPADIAWFDRQECRDVPLPDAGGSYERCTVRVMRVAGYAASRGATISGAGIGRLVYLDLDAIERDERESALAPAGPPLQALPAHGAVERRDLREPLDVALRLERRAREDAGARYPERLLQALAAHEEQHIRDFADFIGRGVGGQLLAVVSAGLSPSAVRAEIERRAQLAALRSATDPRIALAHALAFLPVESGGRGDEHATGYEALVREFVERLDSGLWEGAASVEALGLDRGRVLVQQLDRLAPETVRAIAAAMDD